MSMIIMTIMIQPTLPKIMNSKSIMTQSLNTMGLTVMMLNLFFFFLMIVTHSECKGRRCSCLWPEPRRHTAVLHVWALELYTLCRAVSHSLNYTPTTRPTHSSRHPLRESDTNTNLYEYEDAHTQIGQHFHLLITLGYIQSTKEQNRKGDTQVNRTN